MSDSWVVQNLENALNIWNGKLEEIRQLVTSSPETFRGGGVWQAVVTVHGALQAVGLALLVLFFAAGAVKTCGSFAELKRPEQAVRLFIRFALAKAAVTWGMEIMKALAEIAGGMAETVLSAAPPLPDADSALPREIVEAVENCSFLESVPLWAVSLIGGLFVWALSFVMILSVYGRFFRLYLYAAVAPVPLAAFAGEPTQNIGKSFLRGYAAACLEGAVVVLACVIFSAFASGPPEVDVSAAPAAMVWKYLGELIFNMLILVGAVKMADRVVREITGL